MIEPTSELRLVRIPCPLCGAMDCRPVMHLPDNWYAIPGIFSVERCANCGHEFMNPQPVAESLADCYPEQYEPHQESADQSADQSGETESAPWYLSLRHIPGLRQCYHWLMDDRSQPVPDIPHPRCDPRTDAASSKVSADAPTAIELGCAAGRYLLALQDRGWAVQGVELCGPPAEAARRRGLNVIEGTLETANLPTAGFDLAAAWMVIEHVPAPRQTLCELRRILRPGGQLLLSVPNARCWQRWLFGRAWYGWDVPRHLQHFGPASIRQLLASTGFHDVRVIHQRTLLSMMGSIGLWLRRGRDRSNGLASRFVQYPDRPRLWLQLLLAPGAIVLSWLRQGERLTVTATVDPEFPAGAEQAEVER